MREARAHRRHSGRQGKLTSEFVLSIVAADLAACEGAGSFLQSAMWGRFKSRFGWEAKAFLVEWAAPAGRIRPLLALCRRVAPGVCMAYVPWGPELPADFPAGEGPRGKALAELAAALRPFLPRSAAFIRFDPPWLASGESAAQGLPLPFRRAAADIQPPDTVVVDLAPSEQGILAAMKPKWRYNIRLAEKRGVAVSQAQAAPLGDADGAAGGAAFVGGQSRAQSAEQAAIPDIGLFYGLLAETAARDGIAIHSAGYYKALFEECAKGGAGSAATASGAGASAADGCANPCSGAGASVSADAGNGAAASGIAVPARLCLYSASHEGDCLAAIVVLFRGEEATYLYGASSNAKRNLMAPYALQWRAMRDAKAAGCLRYDLFGIPPGEDPAHPMAGLYRFKTGFGGSILRRPGSWDYPCRPALCALFSAAERLRKKLRNRRKTRGSGG